MIVGLALVLTLGSTPAARRAAGELARKAQREYAAGRASKALADLTSAHRLDPRTEDFLAIGLCETALGHPSAATAAYTSYLRGHGRQRARAEALLAEAERKTRASELLVAPLVSPVPLVVAPKPPAAVAAPPPLVLAEPRAVAPPPVAPVPLVEAQAEPSAASTTGAPVPAQAVEAPAAAPRRHELAVGLLAGGTVAAALAVVGFAEVAAFDGYSHGLVTAGTQVSYGDASGRLASARGWEVAASALSVAALLCFGAAGVTW